MPTYSDILMMKALSSSELLATPNMPIVAMPFATAKPLVYGYDASRSETASMEVSKNLRLTATGAYRSYIGLMDMQSVSGGVQYSLGAMTMQGALAANRYLYYGRVVTQYGVSGQLSYCFNPNLALTVFGTYYNTNPFLSMAAFPFVPTTSYGGYMTVGNRSFYVNLGVERRFNAFEHKMETVPIVTPAFKISNKVTIELPEGDAAIVKDELDRKIDMILSLMVEYYGSDKLVIKAGKMEALQLIRSPIKGERVLALQKIMYDNPTLTAVPEEKDIPRLVDQLIEKMSDLLARRSLEADLEQKIADRLEENHQDYVQDIRRQILKEEKKGYETPMEQQKREKLEELEK